MLKPTVNVLKKGKGLEGLLKSLEALAKRDVLVGIPEANSSRPMEGPNNAELAFLHTEGSPAQRIPARPFLQPSIMAEKEEIAKRQIKVIQAALKGDVQLSIVEIEKLGEMARQNAYDWFKDPRNNWPPNAPMTIRLKGSDQPLIDTGNLRKSITYVVRTDK